MAETAPGKIRLVDCDVHHTIDKPEDLFPYSRHYMPVLRRPGAALRGEYMPARLAGHHRLSPRVGVYDNMPAQPGVVLTTTTSAGSADGRLPGTAAPGIRRRFRQC